MNVCSKDWSGTAEQEKRRSRARILGICCCYSALKRGRVDGNPLPQSIFRDESASSHFRQRLTRKTGDLILGGGLALVPLSRPSMFNEYGV